MRQLMYALQFTGHAVPTDASATVLKATTTAPSESLTSVVDPTGIRSELHPVDGGHVTFESLVTFTDPGVFQESGTIVFGDNGHRLRFSTVGEGYLAPSRDANLSHGSVMWKVDGGEGQFSGASGLITSNFFVSASGEVTDNHFGVIFIE